MKLINIGFGNMVSAGRVVAVVSPDSAPVKRLVKEARERGLFNHVFTDCWKLIYRLYTK